ncbi:DNA primase [Idiomarinaceae phage 1N2-2]|uniref:DNA primase n=1 Tax=Idiomarinaceae phage 1N2-2 TaxID=1536592 RepID=UPI0004F8FE03|nr:DNA primase [Idiomarinaceae phage 1N2-2]AIM40757.1 putative primase-helicase [Idiomarinaceae phage 1N2-2]
MADLTNVFGGAFRAHTKQAPKAVSDQIKDAMTHANLDAPAEVHIDGNIHRFSTKGKRGDDAGWYIFYPDTVVAGSFGCWRDGITVNFKQDLGRELSSIEQMAVAKRTSEARKRRESEQKRKHDMAAETVEKIWSDRGAADDSHPYLQRKNVSAHGVRITGDGRIIVPMFSADGELKSLQYIDGQGEKKYHSGGEVKGASFRIGSKDDTIYICEGYATAASIHEATGCLTVMSFSAGNLPVVAQQMREQYGETASIVVVADNDEPSKNHPNGPGQEYGKQAADASRARLVIPPELGDANDYVNAGHNLYELLNPKQDDFLIHADDFSQQPSPIRWLVKNWLQRDALIMVHGPSGGGKTFTVLDMALRMAAGNPEWKGHKVAPGNIVYLAGEGHHGLRGRIAAWKHHNKADKLNMWLSKAGCDLNDAQGYTRVVDAVSQVPKPDLIIVDTLHRFVKGDENSAQDAKTMLDACAALMERFNCSVLLVHHTGVSDEAQHRARGSSAWRGALDIEISVVPSKSDGPMQIVQRKSKDAEQAEPIYAELQSVAIPGWIDEDGEPVTSAVLVDGQAPAETKKDGKLMESIKLFERCWFHTGADTDSEGNPYITSSAGRDALVAIAGLKEATAKNYMKASYDRGMIYALVSAGIVTANGHGFSVTDDTYASSFLIKK